MAARALYQLHSRYPLEKRDRLSDILWASRKCLAKDRGKDPGPSRRPRSSGNNERGEPLSRLLFQEPERLRLRINILNRRVNSRQAEQCQIITRSSLLHDS